jgi:hypothetical protein
MTPNPGSIEAGKLGCTCPVLDNNHGAGIGRGEFWINADCPLHGAGPKEFFYQCNKCGFATLDRDKAKKHDEVH